MFVACHILLTLYPLAMGRTAKSGRRPLSSSEIALLKTLQDECLQVRATLKDKSGRKFESLKHWVKAQAIPVFNSKFPSADAEEGDVGISSVQDFHAKFKFVLANLPLVQESLQAIYLRSSGSSNVDASRLGLCPLRTVT